MTGIDIFDLYRRLLALVVGVYIVVRLVNAFGNLQTAARSATRTQGLLLRYMLVQVLRTRIRRFTPDLLQIALLGGLLVYLLWRHI
ncbi:MAG: hypothetical protein ACE5GE_10995 [Phycisphaerae bacterium]